MEELKRRIKEKKVIPFVGAGVSISVKNKDGLDIFPNWEELLINLNSKITDKKQQNVVNSLLELKEDNYYLDVADRIEKYLPKNIFNKKLKETFDIDFNNIDESTLSLARVIWELDLKLVITTNYDKVLYQACDDKNKICWDIQNTYEQANSLSENDEKSTIWHIHGHIDNIDNIVLTSSSYQNLYTENPKDSKYPATIETLRNKISSHSLLFIGFSLDDEFFVNQLNRTVDIFNGNSCSHYVLCKKGSDTTKLNKNIIPIEYEDYGEPLIQKIKELSNCEEIEESTIVENIHSNRTHNLTTLPPKNDNFIGREEELNQLEKQLSVDSMVYIVNGIGGVGKSELSYKYLHDNKSKYNNIAFVEMTENTSLEELFLTKFKDELHLDEHSTFDTVIQRLQRKPIKNLLLVDNLEKKEDFEKLLPLNSNFDLLLTTRLKNLDTKNQLPLNTLNDKDAKELFLSFFNEDEKIEDILIYLDNHPLFINLTAKALNLHYITLTELRERIKTNSISKIDSTDDKTFEEHIQDTFNKQFVNEKNDDLKELLQYLSIFPSIELSFKTLEQSIAINKLKVKLQKLVERGWLIQKNESYKLHQIIKTFIEAEYPIEYKKITFIFENITKYIEPYDSSLIANQLTHYINIIECFLNTYKNIKDNYIASLLDSICYIYYDLGQYDIAYIYQNNSLNLRVELFGEDSQITAKSYNLMGVIMSKKDKIKESLFFHQKSLTIRKKELGEQHYLTGFSYSNIAGIKIELNPNDKSIKEYYEKTIEITKYNLDNKIFIASSYVHYSTYFLGKKDNRCIDLLLKALDIYKNILNTEIHPLIASVYASLGSFYNKIQNHKENLKYSMISLELRKKIYGENHILTAQSYNNVGVAYIYDSPKKAKYFFKIALKIAIENLEENHFVLSQYYANIANVYHLDKLCIKALFNIEKALNISEKYLYRKKGTNSYIELKRRIQKSIKKQQKAKFKDKGRYCKDI